MRTSMPRYSRLRYPLAAAGLLAFGTALVLRHAPADDVGLAAADIDQKVMDQAFADAQADGVHAGMSRAFLIDFVDPQEGEAGSESEIAALVAEINKGGEILTPVGFYSDGEHLYRLAPHGLDVGDHGAYQSLLHAIDRLHDDPLVEGYEPEIFYTMPDAAISALDLDTPADLEPHKGPRFEPDDPMFPLQWHMEQIRAPEAWPSARGEDVIVAVIDTGVAWKTAHGVTQLPDLAGTKFVAGESFVPGVPDGLDDHAHGSHVAGTIAQTTHNGIGVTGVAHHATIMPLKVLSKDGRGSVGAIANAIRYAADHGAHVINMSLGGPLPSKVLAKAIEYAHGKGVTTICAAGNERRSRVGYPAANKYSVAVAASDYERNLSFYSNWGKDIDVTAPGGDTRSDKNGDGHPDGVLQNTIKIQRPAENDYLWFQGTSMASPHAAGVAALIVGTGVTNPDEVERIMKATAVHPLDKEWDDRFGAGIVDAAAAVKKAQSEYAPERTGLLGLFALLGLGGLAIAGLSGPRARGIGLVGMGVGAIAASGAFATTPLPYAIASLTGAFGSPLWMSAALPVAATLLLFSIKRLRPVLAGVCLGYAAVLAHGALVLPTLLGDLPGGPIVDRLWLAANAIVALAFAARISRR